MLLGSVSSGGMAEFVNPLVQVPSSGQGSSFGLLRPSPAVADFSRLCSSG